MKFLINGADYLARSPGFKLVGRDDYLEKISSILMRSMANSILLVGPGGVGCTALVMGLQASKQDPNAPFDIVSKRFFWLDSDDLFSSGDQKEINESFQKMMQILYRTPDSVLVIEDTRDFIDGARNNGCTHFINSILLANRNKMTQCILESRDEDLEVVLKAHSDLRETYTLIDVEEPVNHALKEIVTSATKGLQTHHGIRISEDAIDTALKLTQKYRTRDQSLNRAQPERTINLLDRALSSYRLAAHRNVSSEDQVKLKDLYLKQRNGEIAIVSLEDEMESIRKKEEENRDGHNEADKVPTNKIASFASITGRGGFDSPALAEVKKKIVALQIAVDHNKKEFEDLTKKFNDTLELTGDIVSVEFSRISGISVDKLNEDEKGKIKNLEPSIKTKLFGQDNAIKKLVNAIKVAKVGKRNGDQPIGSFLFLGPSGVGKTEVSKVLAEFLLDDINALTRFDMSEYMEKHAVSKMIGAPPGYEGFEAGGLLTNLMRRNGNRILLFDEIEKAHPDIFNIFLQILGDGRLTDNIGRTVSFGDAIIIMTTNIGQNHFLNEPDFDRAKELALEELASTYKSEFLNRFSGRQNIVCFDKLDLNSIGKIVAREIANINKTYVEKGITTEFVGGFNEFCADQYDPKIGARGIPGYIRTYIEPVIVDAILDNPDVRATLKLLYDAGTKHLHTSLDKTK